MPKVGGKHYAYTKEGHAAAKRASRRIGKPITDKKKAFGPEQFKEKAKGYKNREEFIKQAKQGATKPKKTSRLKAWHWSYRSPTSRD